MIPEPVPRYSRGETIDERGARHAVEGAPLDRCPVTGSGGPAAPTVLGRRSLPETGATDAGIGALAVLLLAIVLARLFLVSSR